MRLCKRSLFDGNWNDEFVVFTFLFFPTHSFMSIAHNQFILLRQKVIPLQYDEFHKDTEENLPKGNWFCLTKIVHHYIDFETFNHFPEW